MTPTSDKKLTSFMWVIGVILTIFCGAGLTVGITIASSLGETKEKVSTHDQEIISLKRTSVNYIYVEYLVVSNQKIVKVMEATPGSPEKTKALQEWQDFQDEILKRANPVRGGTNNEKILN